MMVHCVFVSAGDPALAVARVRPQHDGSDPEQPCYLHGGLESTGRAPSPAMLRVLTNVDSGLLGLYHSLTLIDSSRSFKS